MAEVDGYVRRRGDKLELVITKDGKRTRVATGLPVDQVEEAKATLATTLAKLRAPRDPGVVTVESWCEAWLDDRKAREKSDWENEQNHLRGYLYPAMREVELVKVKDVTMLDWARGLEKQRGPSGRIPSANTIRKVCTTVRAAFKEAVRRRVIERSPCIWEDQDLPHMEASSRAIGEGFDEAQVQALIGDPRIPEDRRVLYALEFLTGMRTGEAAARTWADWEPVYRGDLGRLIVKTAYNSKRRVLKDTKTKVEKWIPVHPALAAVLTRWKAEGWAAYFGRQPGPEDLIIPARQGGPRNGGYSWRMFQEDLKALGLERQRHYESRSTFINLAEGNDADRAMVARITHPSVKTAKDLYARTRQLWPGMCRAVRCIAIQDPLDVGGDQEQPGETPPETAASTQESSACIIR